MLRRLARECATRASSSLALAPSSSSFARALACPDARDARDARFVSTSSSSSHGAAKAREDEDTIEVTFIDREGDRHVVRGRVGDNFGCDDGGDVM